MRCRFCGSNSLHEDQQHKTFSAGKAVAGAVTLGVVGAAAGFIGKEKKGYRCGACGAFMEAPMDSFTEMQIDSAIRDAEAGRNRSLFDYYLSQFPNIHAPIPVVSAAPAAAAAVQPQAQTVQTVSSSSLAAGETLKRAYRNSFWQPATPVFVEDVIIKTNSGVDEVSLKARNIGGKVLRSVYFQAKSFDDTGDLISEHQIVYQGLEIKHGCYLPEETSFSLHTDLAYRVELLCEKAAFEDGTVWRKPEDETLCTLPPQTNLSKQNFPRLKYVCTNYTQAQNINMEADPLPLPVYMPVKGDGFWLCACGAPAAEHMACPCCGDTWENLEASFSQHNLMEKQQKAVKARAAERTQAVTAAIQTVKSKRKQREEAAKLRAYAAAMKLKEENTPKSLREAATQFASLSGWKDADAQAAECTRLVAALEAKIQAEEKRKAEKAAQEAAAKKKKAIIAVSIIIPVVIAAIVGLSLLSQHNEKVGLYNEALSLAEEKEYEKAIEIFDSLADFKDSAQQSKQAQYDHAIFLFEKKEYDEAAQAFENLGDYEDSEQMVKYVQANVYLENDDYQTASTILKELGDFKDSAAILYQIYSNAKNNLGKDDETAYNIFISLGDYKDAKNYSERFSYLPIVGIEESDFFTYSYEYNKKGQIIKKTTYNKSYSSNSVKPSTGVYYIYSYNQKGQITKMTMYSLSDDSKQEINTYVYDSNGNCTEKKSKGVYSSSNDTITTYSYDSNNRCIKQVTQKVDSKVSETFEYSYNKKGQCIKQKHAQTSIADYEFNKSTHTFEYDDKGNIKTEKVEADESAITSSYLYKTATYTYSYAFDAAGYVTEVKKTNDSDGQEFTLEQHKYGHVYTPDAKK